MKNFKMNNKGITLIALVITIVILIILAGVLINMTLGENGIISKTKEVKVQHIKAQYYEEINIEILEEQMERQTSPKSEAFIVSLDNRLKAKAWRKNSIMCDTDNNQNVDPFDNTILIIETVEDYEIYIEVDNSNNTATIVENSFKKISTPCTITYDSNGGTGTTEGPTTVRNGFKITLPENGFSKTNFEFAGWTLDSENSGKTYSAGSISDAITEDTIFYAKWSRNVVTIEYAPTDGSGTMNSTPANVGEETTLRECTFTAPEGYEFEKWTTNPDGTGDSYTNSITVTDNTNASMTLYAKWKIVEYTITCNLYDGSLAAGVSNPTKYTIETPSFILNNPSKTNYAFAGWTGSNGNTPQKTITISQGTTGNLTYNADWKIKIIDLFNNGVTSYITGFTRVGGENNGNFSLGSTLYLHTWGKTGVYNSINVKSNAFTLPKGYRKVYITYDLSVKTSGSDARFNVYYVGVNTGTTWYDGWSQQSTQNTTNASRNFTVTDNEPCTIEFQTRCGGRTSDYSNATIKRIYCEYID